MEIRVDAYKLCEHMRRPEPRSAQDIGTWHTILDIMSQASVITNAAILCFVSKRFTAGLATATRVWCFLIIEHAIFTVQYAFDVLVDDVPPSVSLQLDRQDFLVSKLINLERDDFDPLAAAIGAEAAGRQQGGRRASALTVPTRRRLGTRSCLTLA